MWGGAPSPSLTPRPRTGFATALALAEERAERSRASLEAAVVARDVALSELPSGVAAETAAAEGALQAAREEQERVMAELASLQDRIDAKKGQLEAALVEAREAVEGAKRAVAAAQEGQKKAITDHAEAAGGLVLLRRGREAEDRPAAEGALREATERLDALPLPERLVGTDEVTAAEEVLKRVEQDLKSLDREIHTAQGALQQVGGAVARDWLRDATEAFELAVLHHREIEEDYEAWRLLLEQMKEADSAQASNLGRALAPAIEDRFCALTQQRYGSIQLTAHLEMKGVVLAGGVRSPEEMSVGTREQLSTLYRLCLGEYLRTAIVLDDQLVQSDDTRMEWFRGLLAEKARSFQIVVFTCRPGDYLVPGAMVVEDGVVWADSEGGFVRAVDLGRVVGR